MPENMALLVPTFWVGILIGISFIATPVKFQATSLKRPVALDIGRATFRFFSRIEWLLAAVLFGAEAVAKGAAWRWPLTAVVAAMCLRRPFGCFPCSTSALPESSAAPHWHPRLRIGFTARWKD